MAGKGRSVWSVILTVFNGVLLLLGLLMAALLMMGTSGAKQNGTFSIGDYRFYLNKSAGVAEEIQKNDLVIIKDCDLTSYKIGDVVAFFYDYGGEEKLTLKEFFGVSDMTGEEYLLPAAETNFAGVVVKSSTFLGKTVRFLQTADGKVLFLWWCVGLTLFAIGVNLLLYVITRSRGQQKPVLQSDGEDIPLDLEE